LAVEFKPFLPVQNLLPQAVEACRQIVPLLDKYPETLQIAFAMARR
jgi:hypothetical protein